MDSAKQTIDNSAPILSLDCNTVQGTIAAGTELAHSQAALLSWYAHPLSPLCDVNPHRDMLIDSAGMLDHQDHNFNTSRAIMMISQRYSLRII